jgi:hypothetical protein
MKIPKKALFTVLILSCFFCTFTKAQDNTGKTKPNSFIIHGNLTAEKLDFYTKSIEAADFEQFRRKNETVTLTFKNGFELELTSAKDLMVKNKMQDVDFHKYSDSPVANGYKYPLFEIQNNGFITAEIQSVSK